MCMCVCMCVCVYVIPSKKKSFSLYKKKILFGFFEIVGPAFGEMHFSQLWKVRNRITDFHNWEKCISPKAGPTISKMWTFHNWEKCISPKAGPTISKKPKRIFFLTESCVYVCMCMRVMCVYVCMCVCVYVCSVYVCVYVCMCLCVYVCMCVCVYVYLPFFFCVSFFFANFFVFFCGFFIVFSSHLVFSHVLPLCAYC